MAAVRHDGRVVSWGLEEQGGSSLAVQPWLSQVRDLVASSGAFCAIRQDGQVVCWGDRRSGGDTCAVEAQLTAVRSVQASARAFAALRAVEGPMVVTWGDPDAGGDCAQVREQLKEGLAVAQGDAAILDEESGPFRSFSCINRPEWP